mmetsp:Transcript_16900/g.48556  ORF Transcript_16900/g.48556 Transcript_16900/m.48556 type:complete len:361 (+) Transcript_16900:86-1168(+)
MKSRGAITRLIAAVIVVAPALSFSLSGHDGRRDVSLFMAGKGMGGGGGGMGMSTKTKGKKNKGKNKKGSGSPKQAPFDAAASLLRMESIYDKICKDAFKQEESENDSFDSITTEYVVTARSLSSSAPAGLSDWVPVSQIVLVRPISEDERGSEHAKETIRAAVSEYCRESYFAATLSAPIFRRIPANDVQYAAEPLDAFHRYVYDDVIEGKSATGTSGGKGEEAMSKAEARKVLDLDEGATDAKDIKSAYRKKTFSLHPDRFVGVERTEEEKIQTAKDFSNVKIAYEVLSSGVRDASSGGKSWYESLGGKQRMEFLGPIDLLPISAAKKTLEGIGCRSAIVGLDPDLAMAFVARNQAAAK